MPILPTYLIFRNKLDEYITRIGSTLLLLWIRCFVAWQFLKSGLTKIRDWPSTLDLFAHEYHVPFLPSDIAAYLGAGGELFFSSLLIIGLFTRLGALGLFFVNLTAVLSYPQLWEFDCPAAINDHFYWGSFLLVILIFGAGRLSLEAWLKKVSHHT